MGLLFISPLKAESISSENPATFHPEKYPNFQPEGDIRRFISETLHSVIGFLWFDNAATARIGTL